MSNIIQVSIQVYLNNLSKFHFFWSYVVYLILCNFPGFITIYWNLLEFMGIYCNLWEFITIYGNLLWIFWFYLILLDFILFYFNLIFLFFKLKSIFGIFPVFKTNWLCKLIM